MNIIFFLLSIAATMLSHAADNPANQPPAHAVPKLDLRLLDAATHGNLDIVKDTIAQGAQPNATTPRGSTALHRAAENGHYEIADFLVSQQANVNSTNSNGRTPLFNACLAEHIPTMELLLKHGALVDAQDDTQSTPLHIAARAQKCASIALLLSHKADPEHKNDIGQTPIHMACRDGKFDVIGTFVAHGANIDMPNKHGFTALHSVCLSGNLEAATFLRKQNAYLEACDPTGLTPLHMACINNHVGIVDFLISEGACIDALCSDEFTPLHWACSKGHNDTVSLLLSKGARKDVSCKSGLSPLLLAWTAGHKKIVELLTGLRVKRNENNALIFDNPLDASASSGNAELPEWERFLCGYHSPLPPEQEEMAQEVARTVGLNDVFFFQTNHSDTHASCAGFSKIGIAPSEITATQKAKYNPSGLIPLNDEALNFKRILYHELHHIKKRDTERPREEDVLREKAFHLAVEMEAELSALYYLFKRDGLVRFEGYADDDAKHPTRQELWRYIARLYNQLLDNPHADFTVVEGLAALYRQEKISENRMIEDHVKDTKERLVSIGMLSGVFNETVYQTGEAPEEGSSSHSTFDADGVTALHIASACNDYDAIERFVTQGGNIDLPDESGKTALHWACMVGNLQTAQFLRNHNAHLEAKDSNGFTPLHTACRKECSAVAEFLISEGAEVEPVCSKGLTPLHWACVQESSKTVKFLLSKGARADCTSKNGKTPLFLARKLGNEELISLLTEAHAAQIECAASTSASSSTD